MSKVLCTLNPHACNAGLTLSQGNRVVTTNAIEDFHRAVFGTIAIASGRMAFECTFWSTSRPTLGLVDLCSVGVAKVDSDYNSSYVGESVDSFGLRPSDGSGSDTGAGIYNGGGLVAHQTFNSIDERSVVGVLMDCTSTPPVVSFHVNGSYLGQADLTAGVFYVPAVSIGSTASVGDVSAYLNFGQNRFDYPFFSVDN